MTTLRRTLFALMALCVLSAGLSGCGTVRYVTHIRWQTNDTFYVAFSEQTGLSATKTLVRMCKVGADNKVACTNQPSIDNLLNPAN